MSSLPTMEAEFLPQSGARSSSRFSVQRESVGRGWASVLPKRSSSDTREGSGAGQAGARAGAEPHSVSLCRSTLSLPRLRNGAKRIRIEYLEHDAFGLTNSKFDNRVVVDRGQDRRWVRPAICEQPEYHTRNACDL